MHDSFLTLHKEGFAHSVEVWNENGKLVGGLYGVLLNRVFSGESMFSHERDMSKVALVHLAEWLNTQNINIIRLPDTQPTSNQPGRRTYPYEKSFLNSLIHDNINIRNINRLLR